MHFRFFSLAAMLLAVWYGFHQPVQSASAVPPASPQISAAVNKVLPAVVSVTGISPASPSPTVSGLPTALFGYAQAAQTDVHDVEVTAGTGFFVIPTVIF